MYYTTTVPVPPSARVEADAAYQYQRAVIAELLEQVAAGVQRHSIHQAEQPRNWGYVGDLASIAESLQEAVNNLPAAEPNVPDVVGAITGVRDGVHVAHHAPECEGCREPGPTVRDGVHLAHYAGECEGCR